jgi:hypothetical protein
VRARLHLFTLCFSLDTFTSAASLKSSGYQLARLCCCKLLQGRAQKVHDHDGCCDRLGIIASKETEGWKVKESENERRGERDIEESLDIWTQTREA